MPDTQTLTPPGSSAPATGATAVLTPPVPAAVPAPVAAPAAPVVTQKRVLIVEDERPLAHALELKLGHEGYATAVARTGVEGLKMAQSETFDIILLDLILPELDGFALLQQLRQTNTVTPVIVLSNLGQEEDKQRVMPYNIASYLVKSNMPLSAILATIKSFIVSAIPGTHGTA